MTKLLFEIFFKVDIYGKCGSHECPRTQSDECFKTIEQNYKFYLAFENSNCKDYITEKFYVNGLMLANTENSFLENIPI